MSDCLGRTRAFYSYLLKHLTEGAGDFLKNCNMTKKDSPPFTQLCPFGGGARGPFLSPPWDGGPLELEEGYHAWQLSLTAQNVLRRDFGLLVWRCDFKVWKLADFRKSLLIYPTQGSHLNVRWPSWAGQQGVERSPALEPQAPRSMVSRTEQAWCLVGALSLCMSPFPI